MRHGKDDKGEENIQNMMKKNGRIRQMRHENGYKGEENDVQKMTKKNGRKKRKTKHENDDKGREMMFRI